jgi:endonuclease/exonuclease/phosphatase (EEP) superfamily protein YafD
MVRRTLAVVAMGVGIVATLATVGSFFGGIWWGLDLLANYRWQLMWTAMFASVMYALAGRGIFTAVFIVAAAINLWLILPAWTGSQPAASGEGTVRVTHADLSGTLDDTGRTVAWLVESDADLLLVAGATRDTVDAISSAAPTYVLLTGGKTRSDVVAFARDNWRVTTDVTASGDQVHRITVPSGTGVIDVITAWGPMATSTKASDALKDRFATITDTVTSSVSPVAVIGDLGATRWSVASRRLLHSTVLRDATAGSGYLPTWPVSDVPIIGSWIGIPIDVVYLGPGLTPLDVVVGPDIGANHLPLTIDISPVGP